MIKAEPAFYKYSKIFDYLLLSHFTIHFDKKIKIMKRSCEKYCKLHLRALNKFIFPKYHGRKKGGETTGTLSHLFYELRLRP